MIRWASWQSVALAFVAAACTSQSAPPPSADRVVMVTPTPEAAARTVVRPPAPNAQTATTAVVIASGVFEIPAASAFGDPGFHAVLRAAAPARRTASGDFSGSRRLVLSLRDLSRPGQTCSNDHPLSGCATVDWSDNPSRPNVPPSGVFDNSVTLGLKGGPVTLFLSDSGTLEDRPVEFDPG